MADKKLEFALLRDTWDKDGNRQRAGAIMEMTAEEAMDGIEAGSLARVKPGAKAD